MAVVSFVEKNENTPSVHAITKWLSSSSSS